MVAAWLLLGTTSRRHSGRTEALASRPERKGGRGSRQVALWEAGVRRSPVLASENLGATDAIVLGLFTPAGSPSAAYLAGATDRGRMRKDVREFIRRLEALGLTVESTPGHYRVLHEGKPLHKANGMPVHAPLLARHDPLAPSGDRRATQARHRPLARRAEMPKPADLSVTGPRPRYGLTPPLPLSSRTCARLASSLGRWRCGATQANLGDREQAIPAAARNCDA